MIKKVKIENFKCFTNEELEFKNLTLLTGTNSSGKSSVIQSILLSGNHQVGSDIYEYVQLMGDFNDLKNKYINPSKYTISILHDEKEDKLISSKDNNIIVDGTSLSYPEKLTYLNSNRVSVSEINSANNSHQSRYFGIDGRYIANYFELFKEEPIEDFLIQDNDIAITLEAQVDYWLEKIIGQTVSLQTSKPTSTLVKASYKIDGLEFKPNNIGAGISYVISILVACLSANKESIIIIENPEIHMHPKAQAKIGEFFAFITSCGVQIIIETHNDHLINKIRYEVYKKHINSDDVIIHYKTSTTNFERINIKPNGFFSNKDGENSFPQGFYDATLADIFEINSGELL